MESRPKKEAVMLFIVDGAAAQGLLMTGVPNGNQSLAVCTFWVVKKRAHTVLAYHYL